MMNNLKLQEKAKKPKNLFELLENKGILVEEPKITNFISKF